MTRIHPTALVHQGAQLGEEVSIGPYAVIEEDVIVGEGSEIAAHCVIKQHSRIGRRNRIAEHVVIGGVPQDYKFKPCMSFVEIGDDNLIREGVTIHRGSTDGAVTRVGNRNFLMAASHIGHDCMVGDDVVLANASLLAGFVSVENRAFVSGAVAVHQFCRVGRLAMLGGGSKLTQDALPFIITDGSPARARAINLVGLKRAGFEAADIDVLKRAFHKLRRTLSQQLLVTELLALASPAVRELAEFIQASQRGFARCS